MIYLSPLGWIAILVGGTGATLAAIFIASVAGAEVEHRLTWRRWLLGLAVFAFAPLLGGGLFGVLAAWLYLAVASAVLAHQGMGPLVASDEGRGLPLSWGRALTRGAAFATGGLLAFLFAANVLISVAQGGS